MPLYDFKCADGHTFEHQCLMADRKTPVACEDGSCELEAILLVGTHSNPRSILDHGLGRNRDAAREGRYDPLNPNRRFLSKGREWRK